MRVIEEEVSRAYTYIDDGIFIWIRCGIKHTAIIIETVSPYPTRIPKSYFLYPECRQVERGADLGSLFTIVVTPIELTKDTIPDDIRPYLIHALMNYTDGREK